MDDQAIIALYWDRDEEAIRESDASYGRFCRRISLNLLGSEQDAEECVNDTWLTAWNRIPPVRPHSLKAFFGRITRDLSIDRLRAEHAAKRDGGTAVLLDELAECLPARGDVEESVETAELAGAVSRFLEALPAEDRVLFVRRYWYGDPIRTLADESGIRENTLSQRLLRLRQRLREELLKGGWV